MFVLLFHKLHGKITQAAEKRGGYLSVVTARTVTDVNNSKMLDKMMFD